MSNPNSLSKLMLTILDKRDSIDLWVEMYGENKLSVFNRETLQRPSLKNPELDFIRTVSWLYGLVYEKNREILYFIDQRHTAKNFDIKLYIDSINLIRTCNQHNLNMRRDNDRTKMVKFHSWLYEQCNKRHDLIDSDWRKCTAKLLEDCIRMLEEIERFLISLEKDEFEYQEFIRAWEMKKKLILDIAEVDEMIQIIANEMGSGNIAVVKFRKANLEKWQESLNMLKPDFDFEYEMRRLIESSILVMTRKLLPITGQDIKIHFENVEGPYVGNLLARAMTIYEHALISGKHLTKDDLIAKLKVNA